MVPTTLFLDLLPLMLGAALAPLWLVNEWLTEHQRVIGLVVSLLFGALFFWKGWNNLWAIGL